MHTPRKVSFVIATRNRRDVLLDTIAQVYQCGLTCHEMEVLVVDNASTDGTAAALAERHPDVAVLALTDNRGPCAKALALPNVTFPYVVYLDDDSWPIGDSISRMLDRFERSPSLAAAGFVAHLPDGRRECSALPGVFIGCGVGFRTDALREIQGGDASLFMAAEEYDIAFRLVADGYQVETFDDLHVRHLKSPQSRYPGHLAYYDTRNNLVIACRFLPRPWVTIYLADWVRRYAWLSAGAGHASSFARGVAAGFARAAADLLAGRRSPLPPQAFQRFFCLDEIEHHLHELRAGGVRRILMADLGKNVYAFWRAARAAGIDIAAVAADAFAGRTYRDTPIVSNDDAPADVDAVVIANTSYVHAHAAAERWRARTDRPVFDWFGRRPIPPAKNATSEP